MDHTTLNGIPPVIRDYLLYIESITGKSKLTVEEYLSDLRTFFRYIKAVRGLAGEADWKEISIEDVDIELIKSITLTDIHAFLVHCKNERDNNAATRARKTCCLRAFFKYLHKRARLLEAGASMIVPHFKQAEALVALFIPMVDIGITRPDTAWSSERS